MAHKIYNPKLNVYEEISDKEYMERIQRMRRSMYAEDARIAKIEADKAARGYCPRCNFLLPLSGKCDCGYVKRDTIGKTYKGFVQPSILAMYK